MEHLIKSADAAERLGVNPQRFHRLVALHNIIPALQIEGPRGAKFWNLADIETLEALVAQTQATT